MFFLFFMIVYIHKLCFLIFTCNSDEVGFVHPSQFAAISDSSISMEPVSSDYSIRSKASESNPTDMAFWSKDHKLGISTHVIHPLYNAAKHAFMSSLKQYRMVIDLHTKKVESDTDNVSSALSSLPDLEHEVMNHSRALLLLSCDFGTAWNCRWFFLFIWYVTAVNAFYVQGTFWIKVVYKYVLFANIPDR